MRALGRVLVADDEAKIDIAELALTAMTDLERLHVMLPDLQANYGVVPDWRDREILICPQLDQAYLSIMATPQRYAPSTADQGRWPGCSGAAHRARLR